MSGSRAESAKGRKANAIRFGKPQAEIDALSRELTEAKIADYLERTLAAFPPLTEEQRTRLAELLKTVR
jgi:hypothetical protein